LKAPETKRQWPNRLKVIFRFLDLTGDLDDQARQFVTLYKESGMTVVHGKLISFISYQIQRAQKKEISQATIPNYLKAIKLFCEMNDIHLNWKKITRGMSRVKQAANDRAPTKEEIQKIMEYPDRRIKPIICTMISSGIRIGVWDFLKWKHVKPFQNENGDIVAAKLIVYANEADEYYSFITPEAYNSLKDWMDFRASYGEKVTGDSWLMRDIWQTTNINYGAKRGLATAPKKLKSSGVKRLIERALWEQGIREPLKEGERRHEWKAAHGFRKFFKTHTEQVMKPINVEIIMGHSIGVSSSYYKPKESEVLQDYLHATDLLTISNDGIVLKKQVEELEQKSNNNEYMIRGKMQERDEEIEALSNHVNSLQSMMEKLIASLSNTTDQQHLNIMAESMFSSGILREATNRNI